MSTIATPAQDNGAGSANVINASNVLRSATLTEQPSGGARRLLVSARSRSAARMRRSRNMRRVPVQTAVTPTDPQQVAAPEAVLADQQQSAVPNMAEVTEALRNAREGGHMSAEAVDKRLEKPRVVPRVWPVSDDTFEETRYFAPGTQGAHDVPDVTAQSHATSAFGATQLQGAEVENKMHAGLQWTPLSPLAATGAVHAPVPRMDADSLMQLRAPRQSSQQVQMLQGSAQEPQSNHREHNSIELAASSLSRHKDGDQDEVKAVSQGTQQWLFTPARVVHAQQVPPHPPHSKVASATGFESSFSMNYHTLPLSGQSAASDARRALLQAGSSTVLTAAFVPNGTGATALILTLTRLDGTTVESTVSLDITPAAPPPSPALSGAPVYSGSDRSSSASGSTKAFTFDWTVLYYAAPAVGAALLLLVIAVAVSARRNNMRRMAITPDTSGPESSAHRAHAHHSGKASPSLRTPAPYAEGREILQPQSAPFDCASADVASSVAGIRHEHGAVPAAHGAGHGSESTGGVWSLPQTPGDAVTDASLFGTHPEIVMRDLATRPTPTGTPRSTGSVESQVAMPSVPGAVPSMTVYTRSGAGVHVGTIDSPRSGRFSEATVKMMAG